MLFKHVVLDGLDSVAVLKNARPDTLVEAGKVAKSHQGLKILQALAFSVQEKSNGSHLIDKEIVIIATGPHMSWMNWTCQNQTYMATNDPNLSKIIIVLDFVIVINGTEMNPTSPRYQKISSKDGKYTELANKLQFLLSFISGT